MTVFDLRSFGGIVAAEPEHEIFAFAAAELARGLQQISGHPVRSGSGPKIRLEAGSECEDGFEIASEDGGIVIRGSNPRSMLSGVYTLLEEGCGARFYHLGEESWPAERSEIVRVPEQKSRAAFKTRGFMLEHGDDEALGVRLIDFIAKNRGNAVYVHFSDIEVAGERLIAEAKKRGIEFTVGGHSCTRFLNAGSTNSDQLYAERLQLCYSDPAIVAELCGNIADYLTAHPGIDRLSLWPSDSKNDCECPACRQSSFNFRYVRFMEQLQEALDARHIPTQVEHIAYNAGLHEGMMTLPEFAPGDSTGTDTLFAYWGRDYRRSMDEVESEPDRFGRDCVEAWTRYRNAQPGREFRMLEYYNDFWMMSKFFPFLAPVIGRDAAYFRSIGVDGVISLIVPGRYMELAESGYPWEWIMGVNSRATCRALWEGGLDAAAFADDYITNYCGGLKGAREIYELLETLLPEATSFNVPLFRLRFPDIWLRDNELATFSPDCWTPEAAQTGEEMRRDLFCTLAAGKFTEQAARLEYLPELSGNAGKLGRYFRFLHRSFVALALQLEAQRQMRAQRAAKRATQRE